MGNHIRNSCISVPVPTGLYVSMRDLLSNSNMACGPALRVADIVAEDRDVAAAKQPQEGSGGKKSAPVWSAALPSAGPLQQRP